MTSTLFNPTSCCTIPLPDTKGERKPTLEDFLTPFGTSNHDLDPFNFSNSSKPSPDPKI